MLKTKRILAGIAIALVLGASALANPIGTEQANANGGIEILEYQEGGENAYTHRIAHSRIHNPLH